jgi:hypothetical protein
MSAAGETADRFPGGFENIQWSVWQLITVIAAMLIEVSWITPAYSLLTGGLAEGEQPGVFLFFGAALFISYWVARSLIFLQINESPQQIMMIGLLVVLVALALILVMPSAGESGAGDSASDFFRLAANLTFFLSPPFITFVAVVLIWRRGLTLAKRPIGPIGVQKAFRSGVISFLVIGTALWAMDYVPPFVALFTFFLSSLVAMGSARLSAMSLIRGGRGVQFDRRWLLGLFSMAVISMLVIGILALFSGTVIAELAAVVFVGFVSLIGYVIMLVLTPIIMLLLPPLIWLFEQLAAVIQGMPLPEGGGIQVEGMEELLEELAEETVRPAWVDNLNTALGVLVIAVGILLVLLLVIASLRRLAARRRQLVAFEPDEVSQVDSIGGLIRSLFQNQARQFAEGIARLRPGSRLLAAVRIRIIYDRLMRLSEQLELPRPPSSTPQEFLRELEGLFPGCREELGAITRAYVRVRYGEFPETQEEVQAVESSWERVRAVGRQIQRDT